MFNKYLAIALVASLFSLGILTKFYINQHDYFVEYKAKVSQAAQDQNKLAIEKEKLNDEQTLAVANAYTLDNNRLSAALEQLRKSTNRFSQLPKASDSSKGVNGTIGESGGAPICTQEFVSSALKDAMTLQKWQEWAERLNLPVE